MIGYLRGTVLSETLVDVNGVGYKLHTPSPLQEGDTVELHVTTVVRDDAITLYGFPTPIEQAMFAALTKVSGVGPAGALALLAALAPEGVARAITSKDEATLASVKGIGKKTAATIAATCTLPESLTHTQDPRAAELTAALTRLGYERGAAAEAARSAVTSHASSSDSELLQAALEHASRQHG